MRILLTRSMVPADIAYIRERLDRTVPNRYELVVPEAWDEDTLVDLSTNVDVFLGPRVTVRMLEAADNLKLVQVPWTGIDTLDLSAMNGRDIPICNTHGNAQAVAELGISLALDLLKKVSYHDRKMRLGDWNRGQEPIDLKSKLLNDQEVLVVGCGHIGKRIARIAEAFGSIVSGVDDNITDGEFNGKTYLSNELSTAVEEADVVFCVVPLTNGTSGLFSEDVLGAFKPGALLINVSRAAVIDEDALWNSLASGHLSGFASDVWWNAPKRGESSATPSLKHDFHTLDNVVLSPHRAGYVEGSLPHLDGAADNIAALITGEPLKNVVDITRGY